MKKLIAMIGAVAMSFGLFATDATPFAISFEQAEDSQNMGVDTTSMLFTPPTGEGEWAWTGDPLPLVGYEDGEAFAYGTGKLARRDSMFKDQGLVDNANYLKLATGTEELTRAVGEGNMYLDQLVKFTGFEDPQTNLTADAKIAVWMSEFENEDETTETNLYVTVGKVDSLGNVEQIALKIHGTYELDTWYRISIKSLGDIYKGAEFTIPRAGFLVYINGEQAYSEDIVAKELIANVGSMDGIVKSYMAVGKLFTSIAEDATFTSVSYKGIGAIDDVIIDAAGPEFCQTIDVVIPEVDGAEVDYVGVGGTHMQPPISVPDGTDITVYFKAAEGKKLTGNTSATLHVTSTDYTVDVDDIVVEDVVAKLNDTDDLAESELANALEELQENEFIYTLVACVTDDYDFAADTKITATATGFNIDVGNEGDKALGVSADVAADETLEVSFEDEEFGELTLSSANVAGTVVANGLTIVNGSIQLADGAMIKASTLDFDSYYGTIALVVGAQVKTTVKTYTDEQITVPEEFELDVTEVKDEDGYYTYTAKKMAPEIEYVTFTVSDDQDAFESITFKTNSVPLDNASGTYTVVSNEAVTIEYTLKNAFKDAVITYDGDAVENNTFVASNANAVVAFSATKKETYTVTFTTNGCTTVAFDTKQVMEGEKLGSFDTPAAIPGYTGAWDQPVPTADDVINANTNYNYTYTADTYTITYMCDDGVTLFTQFKQDATIPKNYTVAEVVTLPGKDAIEEALGGTWEAWTNANGVVVADTTGLTGPLTVFAQIKRQGSPGADVVKNSVEGADDIEDPNLRATLEVNATTLSTTLGGPDNVAAWAANVYTSTKIPAEKLAKTSADVIALAVENDLPITANMPTFAVETAEVSEGVAAFAFKLMDATNPVAIEKMTAKVKAMVKYTGDLGVKFDEATDDEVGIELASGAIKVELKKQDDVNAGFMKVEPKQPN